MASAGEGWAAIASNDLRTFGAPTELAEPMDALWRRSDQLWIASAGIRPGTGMVRPVRVDRARLNVGVGVEVGAVPCALREVDGMLFAACYMSGRVDVLECSTNFDDLTVCGSIVSEDLGMSRRAGSSPRQDRSHPHDVCSLPGQNRAVIADLGTDQLYVVDTRAYAIVDTIGIDVAAGPRRVVRLPSGELIVACELDSTVRLLAPTPTGFAAVDCVASTAGDRKDNFVGDLVMTSPRSFVVANRGNGTLAGFVVAGARLYAQFEVSSGGEWPASLDVSDEQLAVANEHSNTLAVFVVSAGGIQMSHAIPAAAPTLVRFAPIPPE